MDHQQPPHILLVFFPTQSHLNPTLQFANHLLRSGTLVTIATTVFGAKSMNISGGTPPAGLSIATFSDGHDAGGGFNNASDGPTMDAYMLSLKRHGSETLSDVIIAAATNHRPFAFVVYTVALSWVADVARRHNTPSALLWLQNAALLSIYYNYTYGYGDVIDECDENDPAWAVKLPSLPLLHSRDLPSFITPSNTYTFGVDLFKEQFKEFDKEDYPIVLLNSFDSLELEIIGSFNRFFKILAIGPILDKTTSFRVDLYKCSEDDYVAWLDTKTDNSVVYVSFGSVSVLSKAQLEELAAALLDTGRPFLWVIRPKTAAERGNGEDEEKLSQWEELHERGMVIPWCSQVEVLSHRAVGSFVTHCGWNSMLESLSAGVPMVGVPQWSDQPTNAKMMESVWRAGVRARVKGSTKEENVVGREEIARCVEEVMGNEEIRQNARRWRNMAVEAAKEGGSSETNLRGFVEDVKKLVIRLD